MPPPLLPNPSKDPPKSDQNLLQKFLKAPPGRPRAPKSAQARPGDHPRVRINPSPKKLPPSLKLPPAHFWGRTRLEICLYGVVFYVEFDGDVQKRVAPQQSTFFDVF